MTWAGRDTSVGSVPSHRTTNTQAWTSKCAHANAVVGLLCRSDGAGLVNGISPSLSSPAL